MSRHPRLRRWAKWCGFCGAAGVLLGTVSIFFTFTLRLAEGKLAHRYSLQTHLHIGGGALGIDRDVYVDPPGQRVTVEANSHWRWIIGSYRAPWRWYPHWWVDTASFGRPWNLVIPLWLPCILLLMPVSILFWRDRRRTPPGHCGCGYDLTGNTSGVCPECGERL